MNCIFDREHKNILILVMEQTSPQTIPLQFAPTWGQSELKVFESLNIALCYINCQMTFQQDFHFNARSVLSSESEKDWLVDVLVFMDV